MRIRGIRRILIISNKTTLTVTFEVLTLVGVFEFVTDNGLRRPGEGLGLGVNKSKYLT